MHRVFLGLGANLGNPKSQMAEALRTLMAHEKIRITAVSALYRSKAFEVSGRQPDYLNAVVKLQSPLSPGELLALGRALELKAGSRVVKRKASRRLDMDWLLYDDMIINGRDLKIPHPDMVRRAFVMIPLAEIAPRTVHPQSGRTIAALAKTLDPGGLKKISRDAGWVRADKE